MKIFSTNNLYKNNANKIENNKSNNYYLTRIENTDSFEKTKNQPTFKANLKSLQKTAQKIIDDPALREKFAGFLAAGFAALTSIALGNDAEENNNKTEAEVIADALTKISQEETNIEEQESQISEENKNENIEGSIVADEPTQSAKISEEKVEDETADLEIFSIELPKKSGAKPKRIIELSKLNDLQVRLSEENAQKLTEICNYLLNNKGEEVNTTAQKLRISLSKAQTNNKKTEIIHNTYLSIFPESQNIITEKVVEVVEPTVSTEETKPKASRQRIQTVTYENVRTKERTKSVEVVGSVDLEKLKTTSKAQNIRLNVVDNDTTVDSIIIKAPGTVSDNLTQNIKACFSKFKKNVYEKYKKEQETDPTVKNPKFMQHYAIDRVLVEDVKKEILERRSSCPYKNIDKIGTPDGEALLDDIADLINSDVGYKDSFTLHGALRFIDRYVNFNSDVSIYEQSENLMNKLKEAFQISIENGIEIQSYEDNYGNIGARAIIKSDKENNPAGYELGGSYDIAFTICEGNEFRNGKFKKYLRPLIHTIFSPGI